jgi:hypothetical protein
MIAFRKISFFKIFVFSFLFFFLTMMTMYIAWGAEEQGEATPLIFKFLAGIFYVLRFPMVAIFENFDGNWFMIGLAINSLLYAFLTERLIHVFKNLKGTKQK